MDWLLGDEARQEQAIEQDGYDARTFNDVRDGVPRLDTAIREGAADYLPTRKLAQDMFAGFYKRAPELVDAARLDPGSAVNHEIMEEIAATQEWADLRAAGTVGDPVIAAIAATGATSSALAALTPDQKAYATELLTATNNAERLSQLAATLSDLADTTGNPRLRTRADEVAAELAATQEAVQLGTDVLAQDEDDRRDTVRRAARPALRAAQEEIAAFLAMEETLGGDPLGGSMWTAGTSAGTNTADRTPLAGRLALAERLRNSADLATLAALCGRMLRLAFAIRESRVDHVPAEVTNIVAGNTLNRLLPSELGLLADPDLEGQFWGRYTERALLEYELADKEKVGRGPIILVEDESLSMGEVDMASGYSFHQWSKAVALTLSAIARHEDRDFVWIHFASSHDLLINTHPAKRPNQTLLLTDMDHNFRGGTSYDRWMTAAYNLSLESQYDRADVILLSDGVASMSPSVVQGFKNTREDRGMRCYSVLFGGDYGGRQALDAISDAVFPLASLADDGEALAQVFAV